MNNLNEQNEVNAKMQAEKAYYSSQGQVQVGIGGQAYYGDCAKEVPLREALKHRLHRADYEHDTLTRAAKILDAHPEFEDLLWLVRSGLV